MAKKRKLPVGLEKPTVNVVECNDYELCKDEFINKATELCTSTDFILLRCNHSLFIENKLIKPLNYYICKKAHNVKFTEVDIENTMQIIDTITDIFSTKTRYQPTIITFCRLMNISTSTFNNWCLENNERGEAARIVQDYFKSTLSQSLITGEINPVAGSFIGKTTLGMKENDGNNTNINIIGSDIAFEDIMAEYEKNRKICIDNH